MRRSRFLALAAATAGASRQAVAQTLPVIRFATTQNDSAMQILYAQDMGFLKRAGLNVEISMLTSGAAIAAAVAGGAIDVGGNNIVGLATAVARGLPFVLLAGGGLYVTRAPTTVLAVAKNSPLKTAKDLEGKIVSVVALRDLTYASAASWLEQNGADLSTIKFTEIPFPEAAAALERGTVAAAVIAEPFFSAAAKSQVRLFGKCYDAIAKEFLITGTFTTTDWIRKNPESARKLSGVMYESSRWANANKTQSGDILANYAKLDANAVRTMTRVTYAVNADPKLIQPALDIAYKFKLMDRAMNATELLPKT
jgi:NitT/TauT family transport system substrate-binding protein